MGIKIIKEENGKASFPLEAKRPVMREISPRNQWEFFQCGKKSRY